MDMGEKKRVFGTILITGMTFLLNYGINLFLTSYIIQNVGTEAYGFVSLAKQFAQYASIITMALNTFAVRYIVMAYHNKEYEIANTFFSSVFYGDVVLAGIVVTGLAVVTAFLDQFLRIPKEIVWDVKELFFWVFINLGVTTVFTAYSTAAYIKNKLDVVGIFRGLSYGVEAMVLALMYCFFPAKVSYVGIGLLVASMVIIISNIGICKKYTPKLQLGKRYFSLRAIKQLMFDGIWNSINELGAVLNSGLDLIVCNLMLTPLEMGQLAVAKMIGNIFLNLFQMVAQPFQPLFLKSYAKNEKEKLLGDLKFSMKVSGLMSSIAFAGFTALGMTYYRLWIPNQDIERIYVLTVLTIMINIPGGPMQPLYYIYTLTVKRKIPCIVTFIGGLINVLGMYILIQKTDMGVYAIALTTVVVMFVINFIINPLYMAHVLKLPLYTFFPNVVRNGMGCIGLVILYRWLARWYEPNSWLMLGICALAYATIGTVVYLLIVCEREEWNTLKKTMIRSYEDMVHKR